jgi:hypothetical protein
LEELFDVFDVDVPLFGDGLDGGKGGWLLLGVNSCRLILIDADEGSYCLILVSLMCF